MINSIVHKEETEKTLFPKLMESERFVVLFRQFGKGTIIWEDNTLREVGDYFEDWDMEEFINYNDKVTLINI
jgi:hypothetical protein